MRRLSSLTLLTLLAVAVIAGLTGVAFGVSSGGYDPSKQDCSPTADAYNKKDTAEPGCHAWETSISSGDTRYFEFGIDQVPDGPSDISYGLGGVAAPGRPNSPHSGCIAANTNGTGGGPGNSCGQATDGVGFYGSYDLNPLMAGIAAFLFDDDHPAPTPPADPAQTASDTLSITPVAGNVDQDKVAQLATEWEFYNGADDNLDAGEHDGVDGRTDTGTDKMPNGPSDGGAIAIDWHPLVLMDWAAAVMNGDTSYLLRHPVPILEGGVGACADSICAAAWTGERDVYNGTGENGRTRNVANYDGKHFDPDDCSSGNLADEGKCDDPNTTDVETMNSYRDQEADHVVAEPGVSYYEDPDPQGSPLTKVPHSALYAGTCGVIVGGGYAPVFGMDVPTNFSGTPADDAGFVNDSGQFVIDTGC
jgi:hypothetical protein